MRSKHCDARRLEASRAENGGARGVLDRQAEATRPRRDHSHIARADAALGHAGLAEVTPLVVPEAHRVGFGAAGILSSAPTAQALPRGYPNEPGLVRGLAQRCGRAFRQRKQRGVWGLETALAQGQTVLRSLKEHPLCTQGKADQRAVWTRILREVGPLMGETRPVRARGAQSPDRVSQNATATLASMHDVLKSLIGQMVPWVTTGVVAKDHIMQVGIPQARAMGRNTAGQQVEVGCAYVLSRLGGGDLFGTRIAANADETTMPLKALVGDRRIFGPEATPEVVGYDRGGDATRTREPRAQAGVQQSGMPPKGQRAWHVAEAVRDQVRSERGQTEGIMGTLQSDNDKFNQPKERLWPTLAMAGPQSILSFNLHKLMRDSVDLRSSIDGRSERRAAGKPGRANRRTGGREPICAYLSI